LSGRLLSQQAAGGDQWTVVELKAVSPAGDALWPEKFDSEALARIKANISAQDWAALYQQEPTQEVGSYFKEDWLIPILDLPPRNTLNVYGAPTTPSPPTAATTRRMWRLASIRSAGCFCPISGDSRPHPMCGSRHGAI